MDRQLVVVPLTSAAVLTRISAPAVAAVGQVAPQQTAAYTFPVTVIDTTGTEVTITDSPEWVITTNPGTVQTMWELGARDEVVGISQHTMYLDGTADERDVSGSDGLNVEAVIGLEPDLVLVPDSSYNTEPDRIAQLRPADIPVVVSESGGSLATVADKIERISRMTGNREADIERTAETRDSMANIGQILDGTERPVGLNSFFGYSSGLGTFISDITTTAGLQNGVTEANLTGFVQINEELVVEMNPEHIVVPGRAPVSSNLVYNSTTTMQEGNVIVIEAHKLQRPVPQAIEVSETVLGAVYPDAYERCQQLETELMTASTENATKTTTAVDVTITDATETESTEMTMTGSSDSTTESGAPGFGVVTSLTAIGAAFLLACRR